MAKEIEVTLPIASGACRHYGFSPHFTDQYLLDVLASVNTAFHTQSALIPAESGNRDLDQLYSMRFVVSQ